MTNLLTFPTPNKRKIPTPVCAQPGDKFERVELADDSLASAGFYAGGYCTVLAGAVWHRHPHVVLFDGEAYLGVIHFLDPVTVEFTSWHQGLYSGRYLLHQIQVLGPVVELFTDGDRGPRWILWNKSACVADHQLGQLIKEGVIR